MYFMPIIIVTLGLSLSLSFSSSFRSSPSRGGRSRHLAVISRANDMVGTSKRSSSELASISKLNSYWAKTGKQLIAGAVTGCVEASLTYPTDYIKVMLQLDDRSGQKKLFRNSFDVIRQTIPKHGALGIYRGFSVVFYGSVPKYASRFGAYEQLKQFYADENGQLKGRYKLICGLGAGVCEALFAVIPQESIKVKFINDRCSDKPKYKGLTHGVREIVREKGIRGTYQGVMPTLLKQGSNQAIRFFVFETLKEWNGDNRHLPATAATPVFGAIAGAVSVFGNTPLDVVKTRMQGLEAHRYSGMWNCIAQIYRNEGPLAFYKGTMPRLLKVTLEVTIAFSCYDYVTELLFKQPHAKH